MHENRGIESDDVVVHLCHFLPPEITDVVLEIHTHRTVVVSTVETTIDLTGLEYEAAATAKRYDFIHCNFSHFISPRIIFLRVSDGSPSPRFQAV